jgi:acylphosphatase
VCGVIRNLPDGRVELEATGEREELDGFLQAVRDSGLGPCIRQEDLAWGISVGPFKGFEIVR